MPDQSPPESKAAHTPGDEYPWPDRVKIDESGWCWRVPPPPEAGPCAAYLRETPDLAAAPETKRQRDMLLAELKCYYNAAEAAWKELAETHPALDDVKSGRAALDATAALISACEESGQ